MCWHECHCRGRNKQTNQQTLPDGQQDYVVFYSGNTDHILRASSPVCLLTSVLGLFSRAAVRRRQLLSQAQAQDGGLLSLPLTWDCSQQSCCQDWPLTAFCQTRKSCKNWELRSIRSTARLKKANSSFSGSYQVCGY